MRFLALVAVLSALSLRFCGDDAPTSAPPSGTAHAESASADVAPPTPVMRHGGAVAVAGAYGLEVLAMPDGTIAAYVTDARGEVPPAESLMLSVTVPVAAGAPRPVALAWNASGTRYEGSLGEPPAPGTLHVHLWNGAGAVADVEVPQRSGTPGAAAVAVAQPAAAPTPEAPTEPTVATQPAQPLAVRGASSGVLLGAPRIFTIPTGVQLNGPALIGHPPPAPAANFQGGPGVQPGEH